MRKHDESDSIALLLAGVLASPLCAAGLDARLTLWRAAQTMCAST
jgi:hypothetical protein